MHAARGGAYYVRVDHQTALQAANQAFNANARRSENRISSVELEGIDSTEEHGARSLPKLDRAPSITGELWQIAGMITVAVVTLSFVVSLWFM